MTETQAKAAKSQKPEWIKTYGLPADGFKVRMQTWHAEFLPDERCWGLVERTLEVGHVGTACVERCMLVVA
jgi:hypothetical protein